MMRWPLVWWWTLEDEKRSVRVMRIEVDCLRQGRAEADLNWGHRVDELARRVLDMQTANRRLRAMLGHARRKLALVTRVGQEPPVRRAKQKGGSS